MCTANGSYYTAKYIHIGSKTKEILYQPPLFMQDYIITDVFVHIQFLALVF